MKLKRLSPTLSNARAFFVRNRGGGAKHNARRIERIGLKAITREEDTMAAKKILMLVGDYEDYEAMVPFQALTLSEIAQG